MGTSESRAQHIELSSHWLSGLRAELSGMHALADDSLPDDCRQSEGDEDIAGGGAGGRARNSKSGADGSLRQISELQRP